MGYGIPNKLKRVFTNCKKFVYISGIQTVRILKRTKRRMVRFFEPVAHFRKRVYQKFFARRFRAYALEAARVREGFQIAGRRLVEAGKKGVGHGAAEVFKIAYSGVRRHKNVFAAVFHVAAPVAAIAVLAVTIQFWSSQNYGLALEYEGQQIGYIQNESVLGQATEMVSQRIVGEVKAADISATPTFSLSVVDSEKYATASNVCDKIIEASNDVVEEASGLYIDNEFIGAVKSGTDLKFILQSILNQNRTDDTTLDVEFAQDVQVVRGYYPADSIVPSQDMQAKLSAQEEADQYYTVQDGDAPLSIAAKFDMPYLQLKQLNAERDLDHSALKTGDQLKVVSAKNFLSVRLVREETYTVSIPYDTVKQKSSQLYIGSSKVAQAGKAGVEERVDKVTYVDNIEVDRENVSSVTLEVPVDQKVLVGTKQKQQIYTWSGGNTTGSTQASSGQYMWPVPASRRLSRVYGYYYGSLHGAIDIVAPRGSAVLAADAGVVVQSGWHYGYGWCILIRHDNGQETFYAHCSSLNVSAGTRVAKGALIAAVGNTGSWSRGNHLHFEVHVNGIKVDPRRYL